MRPHTQVERPRATWPLWTPLAGTCCCALATGWLMASQPAPSLDTGTTPGAPPAFAAAVAHDTESRDCVSCHRFEQVLSHPVDVVPSMAVPADLPLSGGLMTCTTCHVAPDGHDSGRQAATVRASSTSPDLCSACHQPSLGSGDIHARDISTRAHLRSSDNPPASPGGLDAESLSCLSCHDGTAASDSDTGVTAPDAYAGSGNHPIGIPYATARRRGDAEHIRLVNAAALDQRVRLFGDAVGCGSCHSVYAANEHKLVIPNTKSRLCMACHVE